MSHFELNNKSSGRVNRIDELITVESKSEMTAGRGKTCGGGGGAQSQTHSKGTQAHQNRFIHIKYIVLPLTMYYLRFDYRYLH